MNKLNILMIDPWQNHYIAGLIEELSIINDVTLFTNHYYDYDSRNARVIKGFFKFSERIKKGILRKMLRGLEYFFAYVSILKLIKQNDYKIIHIQWLLYYKIDIWFLKKIKRVKSKMVLTAHNVIPHTNQTKYVTDLRRIYSVFDVILVHGQEIKNEFDLLFPEYLSKVRIQFHGVYKHQKNSYLLDLVSPSLHYLNTSKCKVFIMFGNIFYNKGFDRIVDIWKNKCIVNDSILIIAGKIVQSYKEFESQKSWLLHDKNIVFIPNYIDENTLRFLIHSSDCIILPYRHATMSGVVFTAAAMKKTVLTTKTGAIPEYLDSENSFIAENCDSALLKELEKIITQIEKYDLKLMGERLSEYIYNHYSWEKICINLLNYYKE